MKLHFLLRTAVILFLLLMAAKSNAQQKISFDLAAIRNTHSSLNGLNVSCFYHFNEKIAGGIEVNRFFPATHHLAGEKLQLSAWDLDINFHYLLTLHEHLKFYPLTGISYTAEKESVAGTEAVWTTREQFFSFNTGAGLLFEYGRWSPHIEYSYTWGHINQRFLLAGISYELEWGHHTEKR